MRERRTGLVAAVAALTLSAGCVSSVGDLPLPGGADLGSDPFSVQIQFADVLDLVPQSAVKVNDVTVGRVTDISLEGWRAKVTVVVNGDVELPEDARASIRQTSILGEKFVSLEAPQDARDTSRGTQEAALPRTPESPASRLSDGDVIPINRTGNAPEIEQVLASLSLVLNGGALGKAQVISQELNTALKGRENDVRSVVRDLDTFLGVAEESKADIVRAIEQIDELARNTTAQQTSINAALDDLPAAITTVNEQRANLVKMLAALAKLGTVGSEVIVKSKEAVVADLRALEPTLDHLATAGDDLNSALEVLPTFPFPDSLFGDTARQAAAYQKGNYLNASVDFKVDLAKTIGLMTPAERRALLDALGATGVDGVMAGTVAAP